MRSPISPRNPKYVGTAVFVGKTAGHEQKIGEPVDIFECFRRNAFVGLVIEFGHQPLAAPANRPGEMQVGRSCAATRQDEGPERGKFCVEPIDLLLEPLDLRCRDGEACATGALALIGGHAKISLDIEQVVLDASQYSI